VDRSFAIDIFAGPRAAAHIRAHGVQAADISAVTAAAGGPKGLALLPLDRWVFGHWLASAKPTHVARRQVIGASIGAWRMAAGSRRHPIAFLNRFEQAYLERQRYPDKPRSEVVAQICRQVVQDLIQSPAHFLDAQHPDYALQVITARSQVKSQYRALFAKAALLNTVSRSQLGRVLQRHVWHSPEHQQSL
jgi:hypothetical protein